MLEQRAMALVAVALASVAAHAGDPKSVVIESFPLEDEWVADGKTLYQMDVRLDASEYSKGVAGVTWTFAFEDDLTFVTAAWPKDDFFFGDLEIFEAFSDPAFFVSDTQITGTVVLLDPLQAPVGARGTLASYWFTVDTDAEPGERAFGFVEACMSILDVERKVCGNLFCSVDIETQQNHSFTVVLPCPADVDGSGAVDFGDILAILAAWGPCEGECPEDLDGSGAVDFGDILAVLAAWGPCE